MGAWPAWGLPLPALAHLAFHAMCVGAETPGVGSRPGERACGRVRDKARLPVLHRRVTAGWCRQERGWEEGTARPPSLTIKEAGQEAWGLEGLGHPPPHHREFEYNPSGLMEVQLHRVSLGRGVPLVQSNVQKGFFSC